MSLLRTKKNNFMKGKVLVIEDDEFWKSDLCEFLEDAGFHVEVVSELEKALEKVKKERFHFITIDMQLNEANIDSQKYEGWEILEIIKKLRVQDITPAMVITGFGEEYSELKNKKKLEAIYFMSKGLFDKKEFIEIIEKEVSRRDLRFKNDFRGD
jgi:CheY-like chemotaxis protein